MTSTRATVFGTQAAAYDRFRPAPVPEALDWLLAGHDARPGLAVDLAAGSGLVTRALVGRARRVVAVEPDGRMLGHLLARAATDGDDDGDDDGGPVAGVRGVAEAVPLAASCADAVVVSSAWHWFDAERAVAEVARVLRPGGTFGLLWNRADPSTEWVAGVRALGRSASGDPAQPARSSSAVELPSGAPFAPLEQATFRTTRTMSRDDVAAMVVTYSSALRLPDAEREEVRREARAFLDAALPDAGDPLDVPVQTVCRRTRRV